MKCMFNAPVREDAMVRGCWHASSPHLSCLLERQVGNQLVSSILRAGQVVAEPHGELAAARRHGACSGALAVSGL